MFYCLDSHILENIKRRIWRGRWVMPRRIGRVHVLESLKKKSFSSSQTFLRLIFYVEALRKARYSMGRKEKSQIRITL